MIAELIAQQRYWNKMRLKLPENQFFIGNGQSHPWFLWIYPCPL